MFNSRRIELLINTKIMDSLSEVNVTIFSKASKYERLLNYENIRFTSRRGRTIEKK